MQQYDDVKQLHFFKDSHGKIVIWQWPNLPLYGWLVFRLLSVLVKDTHFKHGCIALSMAFLFTWAYLEITSGVNIFRRLLGVVVLVGLIVSYFK